jgi:hypothetical protein
LCHRFVWVNQLPPAADLPPFDGMFRAIANFSPDTSGFAVVGLVAGQPLDGARG